MNSKSRYKTKQRELLLGYFQSFSGVHKTANDIYEYFRSQGAEIGQSTIYRHLEKLVDEGLIKKYIIDGNSPACFEYTGPDGHTDVETCYHCKCEKCGRLIHLHCDELEAVQSHLLAVHGFKPDPVRTVIYGLCEECM